MIFSEVKQLYISIYPYYTIVISGHIAITIDIHLQMATRLTRCPPLHCFLAGGTTTRICRSWNSISALAFPRSMDRLHPILGGLDRTGDHFVAQDFRHCCGLWDSEIFRNDQMSWGSTCKKTCNKNLQTLPWHSTAPIYVCIYIYIYIDWCYLLMVAVYLHRPGWKPPGILVQQGLPMVWLLLPPFDHLEASFRIPNDTIWYTIFLIIDHF